MNNIKAIRERLGLTQAALASGMGCTQGNIGHYEQGQTVPPDAARRLIAFSRSQGHDLTFDDVYVIPELIGGANSAPATKERA
ncbi:MAG: transcriptional regulator [Sphingobacteriia bacterium 35-40-8]|jgi:putative transcriptional regulator|nr:MAG: transcriptional regulator [Sphingobacteriia bacterium 35-40-8]